ncbi:MAG: FHA domain-containing protein [Acidobacteriota bacterium]
MTVLAFRPQMEVIDLTSRNLEVEEFDRLDGAANLLIERLQKLERDRDAVDAGIFEKIRKEYDGKLREAERRLKAKRKALTRKLHDMEDARASVEHQMGEVRREIKECELRRRIGEWEDPYFEMVKTEKLSEIEFLGRKVEVLARNVEYYRRALAKEKDSFPCAACGSLNPIWDKRCSECGADLEPYDGAQVRPLPAPAALTDASEAPAPSERPAIEEPAEATHVSFESPPTVPILERTLIRDLASIEPAAQQLPFEVEGNGRPFLLRIQGPQLGETFAFDGTELHIGKAPENQMSIPDDRALSRRHAKIVLEGGRAILYDLGSTNGTAVNGRAVEVSPLEDNDEIAMGSSIYRVHL